MLNRPTHPAEPTWPNPLRVTVVQDGARLHYAVPIALHRAGALRLMFSEGFMRRGVVSKLIRAAARGFSSSSVRAMLQRRADEIPPRTVRTNPLLTARQQLTRNRFDTDESFYEWSSRAVGDWVLRRGIENSNALFGFVRNIDPRLCAVFAKRGVLTVADQMIAPAAVEAAEARIQIDRWPEWKHAGRVPDLELVQHVEQSTWAQLDRITCASEYVRSGLLAQGIDTKKIAVIPYPIDAAKYQTSLNKPASDKPIVIGFVGTVGLRKGAPYFFEVAKRLKNPRLRFVMVGSVQLSDAIKLKMGETVELIGRVTREQTVDQMLKFDLLLFPSTCEGSAGSVTEAMATGLPLVTTPNSGSPVRDGIEGFVRNYDDIDGLASCVEKLAADAKLRRDMGAAGRSIVEGLTLENYGRQLVRVMADARNK
jgi:glycosyltransferase involved in cell wall biosynthesis